MAPAPHGGGVFLQGMSEDQQITVEFYGIPRQRAGCGSAVVAGRTVADVLAAVERGYPGLAGLLGSDGAIASHYRVSIDGKRFVTHGESIVRPGEHVLILSADAGG